MEKKTSGVVLSVVIVAVLFAVFVGYQYDFGRNGDENTRAESSSTEILVPKQPIDAATRQNDAAFMKDQAEFQRYVQIGNALTSLPPSLEGTDIDGELVADAQGNLIITVGARRAFDYFLSAMGEDDLGTIKARIAAYINKSLPASAAIQAWQLLNNYLGYQQALVDVPDHNGSALEVRDVIKSRQQFRTAWLGQEVSDAFFGFDDAIDNFTLSRLDVSEDDSLSAAEKAKRIALLEQELPEPIRDMRNETQAPSRIANEVDALRQGGASEEEVRQLREQEFGVEAADRFEQLDKARDQWDGRYESYRAERDDIVASGLAPEDQQRSLLRLQERLFDQQEVRRVQALDRINDSSAR